MHEIRNKEEINSDTIRDNAESQTLSEDYQHANYFAPYGFPNLKSFVNALKALIDDSWHGVGHA